MTNEEAYSTLKARYEDKSIVDILDHIMDESVWGLALQALKKQIPQKPSKRKDSSWGKVLEVAVCPICDNDLAHIEFFGEGERISYCDCCGQAIDWSEEK